MRFRDYWVPIKKKNNSNNCDRAKSKHKKKNMIATSFGASSQTQAPSPNLHATASLLTAKAQLRTSTRRTTPTSRQSTSNCKLS